ncbi:MAG: pyrroline-5-carboxylate reductase [Gammaproteobacteria bacterium]|nr:pyrroline-5-carboxylate reductase [Gammaproteobacteria bacterium]MBI5616377.1 pyrroline-5-carboxylate reductase [Gammaproteobacteria bacterium]
MARGLAFIGGGNMGRAILGGLLAQGYAASRIRVADPEPAARALVAERYGVLATADNAEAVAEADVVVLAVKPQQLKAVARALRPALAVRRPLMLSIAAGITTGLLAEWLGDVPVVRSMPNTPALVGRGIAGLYAGPGVDGTQRAVAAGILDAVGKTVWVEREDLIDAVTALSGSGPAYFFLVLEALEAAGTALGLEAATARALAIETGLGAAELASRSEFDPATLRAQVTSKGGTTERALAVLTGGGLPALFDEALHAARDRARELAQELGKS